MILFEIHLQGVLPQDLAEKLRPMSFAVREHPASALATPDGAWITVQPELSTPLVSS